MILLINRASERIIMYRPAIGAALGAPETFCVCTVCGTLVSNNERKAHDKFHAPKHKQTPDYQKLTVGKLREILATLNDDWEVELDVLGYEWEYAKLSVNIGGVVSLPLMEV